MLVMARFLKLRSNIVLDTTRILKIQCSETFWRGNPVIKVQYYDKYTYDCHDYSVKPLWSCIRIEFDSKSQRDIAYEKLKKYIPDNIPKILAVEEL